MKTTTNPWKWVPTLYFAEAVPYAAVMIVSILMYKKLGISNTDIALYTSWLNLPWMIKPFWSPFVDFLKTKRWWIVTMQLIIGTGLAGVAFTIPTPFFFQASLAVFWLLAFSSATHDIAADGFYMISLNTNQQSFFVGIRSTFYRLAIITCQGLLVMLAGFLEETVHVISISWAATFAVMSLIFFGLFVYHFFVLPHPEKNKEIKHFDGKSISKEFVETFATFFKKKNAFVAILFMLLYRFPEAQLAKIVMPFLVDPQEKGGLGLTTVEIGFVYGTIGVIGLVLGGIVGGIAAAGGGLKKWLWPMALAITLPDVVFIYLSSTLPSDLLIINICVFIEQFGYGFGFAAYMLYMIYYSEGEHSTAHYAICTAFMTLGLMLPGMFAGWLQDNWGYEKFFWWVMISCAITLIVTSLIKVDPEFGKKKKIKS